MTLTDSHAITINRQRFDQKVALVTGGGSGIGRAAALAFARQRAAVVVAGRREGVLANVVDEINRSGGRAVAIPADVSNPQAVQTLVEATVDHFGHIDIAFNNAGITAYKPIEALSVDEFDKVMATNVRGVWMLLKYEIEAMRKQGRGGAIVNTSSVAASGGMEGLSAYAASKGALDAMIRPLALEAGTDGIRINNVSPGVIDTDMTAVLPDEGRARMAAHAALKRLGKPEDVGDIAVWLCSNEARFITGQNILADGGFNIAGAR